MENASPAPDQGLDADRSDHDPALPGRVDARQEDAYWARHYWRERYYRSDFEYEDYAPAYCVGYAGYQQYGGTYSDAETSLHANWERIKGDSRLGLSDAHQAIRAAWKRAESAITNTPQWRELQALASQGAQQRRRSQAGNQPMSHAA